LKGSLAGKGEKVTYYSSKVTLPGFVSCRIEDRTGASDRAILQGVRPSDEYRCILMSLPCLTDQLKAAYRGLVERVKLVVPNLPYSLAPSDREFKVETCPGSKVLSSGELTTFEHRPPALVQPSATPPLPPNVKISVELHNAVGGWQVRLAVVGQTADERAERDK